MLHNKREVKDDCLYTIVCPLTFAILSIADLVLSGKLVIYDVANLTIGWTEYNCEYFNVSMKYLCGAKIFSLVC